MQEGFCLKPPEPTLGNTGVCLHKVLLSYQREGQSSQARSLISAIH